MSNLEVWASEYEGVICHGKDDIASVLAEYHGDTRESYIKELQEQVGHDKFKQLDNSTMIGVMQSSDSGTLKKGSSAARRANYR